MADGSGHQAGARGDPSSLHRDSRSYHRASCRADITNPCGKPNQVRSHPGHMVPLARSQLAPADIGRLVCRGRACAELASGSSALFGLFCLSG